MAEKLFSINPTNEKLISSYRQNSSTEIETIIKKSWNSFFQWRETSFSFRSKLMMNMADLLLVRKDELSKLMTIEMGKPILQSYAEIEKCALVCNYYAENSEKFLADQIIKTDASKSFVTFQPLGTILGIMPWNFPFWQVFRFAVPTLMAGNSILLKHSSNVTGCALAIEKLFIDAGFPDFLFKTLILSSKKIKTVIENKNIQSLSLTGSTQAGKSVAKVAGKFLKKCVLELGGSDPYLILESADLEQTVDTCVTSRLINGGQSCISAKRFIIVQSVYKKFEELFVEKMKSKTMGDPINITNDIGPQARIDLRNELHNQVNQSIKLGAKVLLGGEIPKHKGAFYPPTVLSNVEDGMPAFDDELFGPVAPLIKVKNETRAIEVANNSYFGLGAAIFTNDLERGEKIAKEKLLAGSCFVNAFVKSDPRLPFGGIKQSGYGRELSEFGIKEFVNIKTVFIK